MVFVIDSFEDSVWVDDFEEVSSSEASELVEAVEDKS